MKKGTLLVLTVLILMGCGVVKRGTIPWEENPKGNETVSTNSPKAEDKNSSEESLFEDNEPVKEKDSDTFVESSESSEIQEMQQFLKLAYEDWKGTPYLLGGSGYTGIDCSAFMQVVFEDYFSLQIPRTTREQLRAGREIKKSELRTGDLVFFKTGKRSYHVGVMVNRKEFLHASTTNGVKISELSYPFWKETYLTSKRLF